MLGIVIRKKLKPYQSPHKFGAWRGAFHIAASNDVSLGCRSRRATIYDQDTRSHSLMLDAAVSVQANHFASNHV
jgi:hypothetical protein